MNSAEKARLYREMAKLLQADFHLDRSLTLLLGQQKPAKTRLWLESLRSGLAGGQSVAEAVRGFPEGLVSGMELALIEAGERGGRLAQTFAHIALYYEGASAAAKKVRSALIYPLVLLHVAVVLPEVPEAVREGLSLTAFIGGVIVRLGLLWVVCVASWLLWREASARAALDARLDALLRRVPLLGGARRHWGMARFCQVFHSGLLAALRMSECCRMAGAAAHSASLREGAERAARQVERGELLSLALADAGAFDPGFVASVASAEEAGCLDEEMRRWTVSETAEAEEAVQRAAAWLPKAAYALVVVYVVWRIFGMAQGYFDQIGRLLEAA